MHSAAAPNMGKIGVLVGLNLAGMSEIGRIRKQLAMHIAAANPQWVSQDEVDQAAIEREREVLAEQARESGKPEEIVQKMVDGRMRKYFEEVCLLEQTFDDGAPRHQRRRGGRRDAGSDIKVAGFVRFQIGEGIEKEEADFAAEVAATAGG